MQPWSNNHYESEPLDSSNIPRERMGRQPYPSNYDETNTGSSTPYFDGSSPHYHNQLPAQGQSPYNPPSRHYQGPTSGEAPPPPPPLHGDNSYYTRGGAASYSQEPDPAYARNQPTYPRPGPEGYSQEPYSAMPGSSRGSPGRSPGRLPPPPSRSTQAGAYAGGGYMYDGYARGGNSPMRSTTSSLNNYGPGTDPYGDDPYGYSSSNRSVDRRLGEVNPHEIEDDGDDGLHYPRHSQRNSMRSSGTSDRGVRPAIAAGTAAAAGVGVGGMFAKSGAQGRPVEYDLTATDKERAEWTKHEGMSKRKKTIIIFGVLFVIIAAIIGGVVGGMVVKTQKDGKDSKGDSAKEDLKKSGVLTKDSKEIKDLLNNPDLHRVFPGMDYTPINSQYPDCIHNPPSQNNVTRDVAVLSQLTNRIRTYGTDCNQTAMVIEAINNLDLKGDMKIWMGVWQDKNTTTNKRQLDEMYKALEDYGDEHFEGLIVANEILFREEMTITELGDLLQEVRSELDKMNLDLPVATSDLGDDWTAALAETSDYLMSNIHPFFAGVTADEAAAWTMNFFETNNGAFFKTTGGKTDKKKNVISETGWPTGGGTSCGAAESCTEGSVAGIDELNTFMNDWVCPALKNGTNYFWFSAFDEPWKVRFNEKGKEWEDKWGIMDVNRNLKDGVKIPDCGGLTIS